MLHAGCWDDTAMLTKRMPSRAQREGVLEGESVSQWPFLPGQCVRSPAQPATPPPLNEL